MSMRLIEEKEQRLGFDSNQMSLLYDWFNKIDERLKRLENDKEVEEKIRKERKNRKK
jgi:hypothetical protein